MTRLQLIATAAIGGFLLNGCGGGGGGDGGTAEPQQPQPQTISFAQSGPLNVTLGSATSNAASGGAGTGAITYSSSAPTVATIDASSGAVSAVGVGTTTVTATKAASVSHLQAQATYTLNVQTATTLNAWIGATNSLVTLPLSANGKQFGRARVADCNVTDTVATCTSAETSAVSGPAVVTDSRATLTMPAYYAIVNGATIGTPVLASNTRFSDRIGHAVVAFDGRYWLIGGGEHIVGPVPAQFTVRNDVWSSVDGRSWKLEVANAPFSARWFHNAVVYAGKIWVISGSPGPGGYQTDVWASSDGVNWQLQTANAGLIDYSDYLNVTVWNNQMLAVSAGNVYTSTNGTFTNAAPAQAPPRHTNATLTQFNDRLWLIGGVSNFQVNVSGNATNDVWRSSADGLSWTQMAAPPFLARARHTAFVRNGRLWVVGGTGATNGVYGAPVNDAWSTSDGVTWTQENLGQLARTYLSRVIQETSRVTFIGGIHRGFSNQVFQTSGTADWIELSSSAPFVARHGDSVEFLGSLWMIGGGTMTATVGGGVANDIWRSADGINWTQVTPSGTIFSPRTAQRMAVFNNRLWLVGGWDDLAGLGGTETRLNDVWSTADGVSWTRHADAPFAPRAAHELVAFNNKLWVIGGQIGTLAGTNDVWSSTNGENWVRETSAAAFSPRYSHRALAFNNELWVIAGGVGTAQADVWRSTDGITWTLAQANAFPNRARHGAAVLNGRIYVAGGSDSESFDTATRYNDVWSSADGISWTQETAAAPFSGRALAALVVRNGELYLTGGLAWSLSNEVWKSSNGRDWRTSFSAAVVAP